MGPTTDRSERGDDPIAGAHGPSSSAHGPDGRAASGLESWPAATYETRPWAQTRRSGTKEDRMLDSVVVSMPAWITELPVMIGGALADEIETALREIVALDEGHGDVLAPLGMLLLRSESVASSKIERIEATIDDYARALHGSKANASASSMVAATDALEAMIETVARTGEIELSTMTSPHHALMVDDPAEHDQAGRLRDVQNWIGSSDHSPRGALYVPPPAAVVAAYMDDLVHFSNRSDLSALAQAAIAHAQFESIHPFTDGNGRIGRALANAILRRRGVTRHVVIPIASALVAQRDRYFAALDAYREGDAAQIISEFGTASRIAAAEARVTAVRLAAAPGEIRAMVGTVRRGSAVEKVLALLPTMPVLTTEEAIDALDAASSSVYDAIERLASAGVLRPLTGRTRNQVWGATVILDELEDLGLRIELASRRT